MSLTPMGLLPREGATVQACREPGDEFEPATVRESNLQAGMIALRFADGYSTEVPFTQVKLETAAVNNDMEEVDQAYEAEVRPTLPLPPTAEALAADPEAKYAFIAAAKDAGNALFKQGKYAWAIRTYCDSVNSLAASCFESRERMLWDYQAREPCGQCYSNAALCALKLEEHARAVELCEQAMGCRPEEADLLKLMLRHGQALAGLGRLDEAKERLERGVAMQPANRPLREELLKVKRRVLEADRAAEKRMFAKVDLSSSGLTSKRDAFASQLEATLARGTEQMLDSKDEQALKTLSPLLDGRLDEDTHRASLVAASYGCGVASYHLGHLEAAVEHLQAFFRLKEGRDDIIAPLSGVPLARFYLGHAAFNTSTYEVAQAMLDGYVAEVAVLGPQPVLNMPDGWQGKKITEADRKASRMRHRATSDEAQSDAHMMLALLAQRRGPAEEVTCVTHCEACVRLAPADTKQRQAAHQEAARILRLIGKEAEAAEHVAAAAAVEAALLQKEEEAAAKAAADAKAAPPETPADEADDEDDVPPGMEESEQ